MGRYRAEPGMEDRHGEMTGAISINMILSMFPVVVWCFFVGPMLLELMGTLVVALALAVVLPIAFMPLSRRIWAHLADYFEEKM